MKITEGIIKPTLVERLFIFLHLPYLIGCIIFTMILGPVGSIFVSFLSNGDFSKGIAETFILYFNMEVDLLQGTIGLLLLSILLFYSLYSTRYMRQKLEAAKEPLLPLLPDKGDAYDSTFRKVSLAWPPLLLSTALLLLLAIQSFNTFLTYCDSLPKTMFFILGYFFFFFAFFNFVWIYFSSIIGLHFLGRKFIRLKSFTEDRMLGVKPIGTLSLSLAFAYFAGISTLLLLAGSFMTTPGLVYVVYLSTLILFGVASFILPLLTTHSKMIQEKKLEEEKLRNELLMGVTRSRDDPDADKEIKEAISHLTTMLNLNLKRDEVQSIPTWPIDVSILGRLVISMLFPITATVIANYLLHKVFMVY